MQIILFSLRKTGVFLAVIFALLSGFTPLIAQAQLSIPISENFDSIGTAINATLPQNWRVDKQSGTINTSVQRSPQSWALAGNTTEYRAGNSMGSLPNGIYNYGAGPADTATDRAVGWISYLTPTKSGNLYGYFKNTLALSLSGLVISYDVEKYRNGANNAGFRIQMFVSMDGITWTSAGSDFYTFFSADRNNNGFPAAPGVTAHISNKILIFPTPIAPGDSFYLAWNYAVSTGNVASDAQGIGIDNFVISAPLAVNLSSFNAAQQGNAVEVTWKTATEQNNRGFNLYRSTTADAPAQQLNSALIPSQAQGSMSGFAYTWTDSDGLVNGQSFYYWVEAVDVNGAATLYGPVSVTYVAPTAVTLSQLRANGGSGSVALWVLPAALLAVGGLAVWRRRAAPLR